VYGVHSYPVQPQGASPAELNAWKARVSSERTFIPEQRPQGYLAFRIDGEVLKQYRAHQQKLAAGETRDEFELFRADGHFSQRAVLRAGAVRLDIPLFLTFFRLERKEPTWVTRTPVGFVPGQNFENRIQIMSSATSAGRWTATLGAEKLTFGALHYEGLEGWGAESRRHGSKTMQFLISIGEGIGEAIGGRQ
jgi:hypothetical protein